VLSWIECSANSMHAVRHGQKYAVRCIPVTILFVTKTVLEAGHSKAFVLVSLKIIKVFVI
jgi:hypothetical protein